MILVIQRVKSAFVKVEDKLVSSIGKGLLVLAAIEEGDSKNEIEWCAEKVGSLRIFPDAEGKMNLSIKDCSGEVLAVSQFTLAGELNKGTRPSFSKAARPEKAKELFDYFVSQMIDRGLEVKTGIFQAMMEVGLVNDGPVTIILKKQKKDG
ncbi:MAG: D-aminoacyl-tRNA deacylase [Acidobacteriota bacterium]